MPVFITHVQVISATVINEIPDLKQNSKTHDQIIILFDQMLQTQKDYRAAKSDADKNLYEQKIALLDKKIDELVYQLYDLTDEEIRVVEAG